MRTKIIYILTSTDQDHYLEQLIMSIHSLKMYNKKVDIIVLVDRQTELSLIGWRSILRKMVTEVKTIPVPVDFNAMKSSRYLKTNLRKLIRGDFLFLDTDTIICCKLDYVDKIKSDIALVADCNGNLMLDEDSVVERCKKAGFENMKGTPYFNSGVMLVRDTPLAHKFYEDWYKFWQYSADHNIYLDQPAMNYANVRLGYPIKELPGEWNCQIFFKGWNFLPNAKILHYAGGGKDRKFDILYKNVRENNLNSPYMIRFFRSPKIKLYAYLTNMLSNKKGLFMLYVRIYLHHFFC